MTREEIKNKLFDIILKNSSPTMVVKRTIDYQQTMVIVEELINHETDLLGEFVEWLKNRFDKRIDEQAAKCERIESEYDDETNLTSYMEYVAYNEGILTGFVNAKWWLEELDTIEKFLEERK